MRRLRRLPMVVIAVLAIQAGAGAAPAPAPLLRTGSHGPQVSHLQRLLAGHDGYVFAAVKPTFTHPASGLFGARTAAAVTAMKWRLGYPRKLVRPIAGPYLFGLLEGTKTRPARWVAIAARRLKAIEASTPTPLALKIKALEISQLGVTEHPLGTNCGAQVHVYQAVTGGFAYTNCLVITDRGAWCISFQQWAFLHAGAGTFAGDTANVYAAADYFAARNELHAKPKVGALVLFIDYDSAGHRIPGTGHGGFVTKVTATGFSSIEGNQANGVHEPYHHLGDRGSVFAYANGVA